jgi:siroheme synthase
MGLSRVASIVQEAIKLRVSIDAPCAIVSNASRENQKIITSTLQNLEAVSKDVERPAILVFGDVVNFNKQINIKYNEKVA